MEKFENFLNWRVYGPNLTTSGQITTDQISTLAKFGVTRVINLGPHEHKDALPYEADIVEANGMEYSYLPVAFDAPKEIDFNSFANLLTETLDDRIHVHCIFNARVTAFLYRYAQENDPAKTAAYRANMECVWKPGGIWATFIDDEDRAGLPHQYAGKDY